MKLLFFDIDGTLYPDHTTVLPESAVRALRRAKQAGHRIFINTGRVPCHIDPQLRNFPFDGYLCACGCHIELEKQLILSVSYDHAQSRRILEAVRSLSLEGYYEGREKISLDPLFPAGSFSQRLQSYLLRLGILGSTEDEDFTFQKFFLFSEDPGQIRNLQQMLPWPVCPIDRGGHPRGWEITPDQYDKGTAIRFVADYLHRSLEDCIAFGDSTNDLGMLSTCPVSVCMGNAPKPVQDLCTLVTGRAEEDGLLNAMEKLELI